MNKGMVALIVIALIFIGTGIGGMVYYGGFEGLMDRAEFDKNYAPKDQFDKDESNAPNDEEEYYHMGRGHMLDGDEDERGRGFGMPHDRGYFDNDNGGFRGDFDRDDFEHCYEEHDE